MGKKNWRVLLTIALVIVAIVAFWDTFRLWTMSESDRVKMQEEDPGGLLQLQQKAIRLGLDLQGGIHVVLRVKTEELGELDGSAKDDAVDRARQVIRNRVDGLGVAEPTIVRQGDDRIVVDLPGYTDANRAEDLIGQTALLQFKLLERFDNAQIIMKRIDSVVGVIETARIAETTSETETATGTETDAAETSVDTSKADDSPDVLAQLTGDSIKDTADAFAFDESSLTEDTETPFSSRLELALYHDESGTAWPCFSVPKKDRDRIQAWLNTPEVAQQIPVDVQVAWSTRSEIRSSREVYLLYFLRRKVEFLGKYLENINLAAGETGGFKVNFRVSSEGSGRFSALTGANVDKPLAVVLDDRVESAPFINSRIRGEGTITMGSSAAVEDARNMEIVLKAGSLPAPVEIIEKNIVGASLGSDSISKGFSASLIGLVLVLLFMAIYYRLSGVIADAGLVFNIFFLLAAMAGLSATLTMPGIAGIILTIGMSVDSNILIFERIREELRTGKTVRASIDAGYERAFVAIFDSHVTTLITAGALFLLGSGPIKGFAVTLFWGIVISLYTAFVITKQMFDFRKRYTKLSI